MFYNIAMNEWEPKPRFEVPDDLPLYSSSDTSDVDIEMFDDIDGFDNPESFAESAESRDAEGLEQQAKDASTNRQKILQHNSSIVGENTLISPGCPIGEQTSIGNYCTIDALFVGREVSVGDRTRADKAVELGAQGKASNWQEPAVAIGSSVTLYNGAKIRPNTEIGDRSVIGRGTIVGFNPMSGGKNKKEKKSNIKDSPKTIIGKDCLVGSRAKIESGAIIEDGWTVADGTFVPKDFRVQDITNNQNKIIDSATIDKWQMKRRSRR